MRKSLLLKISILLGLFLLSIDLNQAVYASSNQQDVTLSVVNSMPSNEEKNVALNKIPLINFNENIYAGDTINEITISTGTTFVKSTYSISGSILKIIPTEILDIGTTYIINIPKNAIKNNMGEYNQENYRFTFETMNSLTSTMTSDTTPKGIAQASSVYKSSTYTSSPYRAFDNKQAGDWSTASNVKTGWLSYTFEAPTIVNKYVITATNTAAHASTSSPKSWTFEGYDLKDSKWYVLDSRSNITGWASGSKKSFDFLNEKPYDAYRINITQNNGFTQVTIGELQFLGYDALPPENLNAVPKNKKILLSWEPSTISQSYNVKRSLYSNGPYDTVAIGIQDLFFEDLDVENGLTYYYVVTAVNNGNETDDSLEASATPFNDEEETNPSPESPDLPKDGRAILVITMVNGLEKEYDLALSEINNFIEWYNSKDKEGKNSNFAIDKHKNNKGPFISRKDYVIFSNILMFEINEYEN